MKLLVECKKLSAIMLFVVFIASRKGEGSASECPGFHLQDHFCQAEWAMKLTVKENGTHLLPGFHFDEKKFDIYRIQIFKSTPNFENVRIKNVLFTNEVGELNLKEETEYFVTGGVFKERLQTTSCRGHQEWANIPPVQKELIEHGLYGQGCDSCQIQSCIGYNMKRCETARQTDDHCYRTWTDSPSRTCLDNHSFCHNQAAPNATTRCRWSFGGFRGRFLECLRMQINRRLIK